MYIIRKPLEEKIKIQPLNKKSLKIGAEDYEYNELPSQVEEFFKIYENGQETGYIDCIFRTDRSFAFINRLNQNPLLVRWNDQEKESILRQFLTFLYSPNNLPYHLLAIECNQPGSNITDDILVRLGFINTKGINLYTSINPNFEQILKTTDDIEVINTLKAWLANYKLKQETFQDELLKNLKMAYEVLKESRNRDLIEAKKIEIEQIKAILENYSMDSSRKLTITNDFNV